MKLGTIRNGTIKLGIIRGGVLGGLDLITEAKSVIFDIADDWGYTTWMGVRSIEFHLEGVLIDTSSTGFFLAYATSSYNDTTYTPNKTFDTSQSKIGGNNQSQWLSGNQEITNQRLIVVFTDTITFDEIIINNGHSYGNTNTMGAKNVKITTSTDEITDITYDSDITSSTILNNTEWPIHIAENVIDDQTVWPMYVDDWVDASIWDDTNIWKEV